MSNTERPEDEQELDYDPDLSGPVVVLAILVVLVIMTTLHKCSFL